MNYYFRLLTFLLFSIPLTIVSGPFFPDLSIFISLIIFIILIFRREINLKISHFFLISVSFFIIIITSFLISLDSDTVFGGYIFYFRFPIMAFLIFQICKNYSENLNYLYIFLSIILFVISSDAIFQYLFGYNFIGFEDKIENRISGFFNDEYILGKYLFFVYVVYFYLHFRNASKFKFFFSLNFILVSSAIFLSGERTSILLYLFFIFLFITLTNLIKPIYKILIIIIIPLILIFIVFTNQYYLERFYPGFNISSKFFSNPMAFIDMSNKYFYTNLMYYSDFIKVSLNIFYDNPLFGVGPKMYRVDCANYTELHNYACSTHPHNTYLQLLSETGIFSFLIIFLIWILLAYLLLKEFFYKYIYKKPSMNQSTLILIISYFVMLFPFLPNNSFFSNNSTILLYFPLGFLLYEIYKDPMLNSKKIKFKIIE